MTRPPGGDGRDGGALDELGAGRAGAGGEGLGGGGGRDRVAGVEEEAGEVLGERGLGLVRGVERLGAELGEARGDVGAGGSSAAGSSPTTSTPTVSSGITNPWPSSR